MRRRRFSLFLASSLLTLSASLSSGVASATAQGTCAIATGSTYGGKVLDILGESTADGAPLVQWSFHGGANQFFAVDPIEGSPYYAIRSVNSGKVLDVAGESTADGAPVIQWTFHGGANQQWAPVYSEKIVVFINVNSGKVLDVAGASIADGAPLIQWTWNGGVNQFFIDGGECIPPVPLD